MKVQLVTVIRVYITLGAIVAFCQAHDPVPPSQNETVLEKIGTMFLSCLPLCESERESTVPEHYLTATGKVFTPTSCGTDPQKHCAAPNEH